MAARRSTIGHPPTTYRFPSRVESMNVKAGFLYEPVHYSLTLEQFSFAGKDPDLTVGKLTGRLGARDENCTSSRCCSRRPTARSRSTA